MNTGDDSADSCTRRPTPHAPLVCNAHDMAPESSPPPIEVQKSFWNSWNTEWRSGELDHFMRRQAEVALEVARSEHLRHSRILEVGCGVGWLGNELREFGDVTGVDLSPTAIDFGRQRFPEITLLCSDFLAAEFPDEFDLIVSADSLAHVPDHRLYLGKDRSTSSARRHIPAHDTEPFRLGPTFTHEARGNRPDPKVADEEADHGTVGRRFRDRADGFA